MNTTDNIEQEVIKIIAEKLMLDESKINKSSSFADDLKADSLDTVELMMEIEAKCGIEISDEEAAKLKTVENVIDYIKKHKA